MLRHKIEALGLLFLCAQVLGASEPITTKSDFKKDDGKPAIVYATLSPKGSSLKFTSVQTDGGAESVIVAPANIGSEFSWGLTNERLHFLLFGEVMRVSLSAPTSGVVKKTLANGDLTVAKGGFGIGLHPTRSRDFFTLLFCSFDQSVFTHSSPTDTNQIIASTLTIPHVGMKLAFTTLKWRLLSLGGDLNAAYAFGTSNADDNTNWGYTGFGRMLIGFEAFEKTSIELAPQFSYAKYFGLLASQTRLEAGVSLGIRVFLD